MDDHEPLDSTPDDGADRPATGSHERLVRRPDRGTEPDTGDQDDEPLNGWHAFVARTDDEAGATRTTVLMRCSDLARMDPATRAQIATLGPLPSLSSCTTCTPHIPDEVPPWLYP